MLEFNVPDRKPKILYIGNGDSNPGAYYLSAFKTCGYDVHHVGDASAFFNTKNLPAKSMVIQGPLGITHVAIREFSLKSLLDIIGYDWDAIFHVQNWVYFTDHEFSPIPYYFYCTEIMYPKIPRCAWYVLSATDAIKRTNKQDCPWIRGFLYHPHSVPIQPIPIRYPLLKKTINSSFAGDIYSLGLYEHRRKIIKYLEKNVEGFEAHYLGPITDSNNPQSREIESGKGLLQAIPYFNLLLKSKYGVNVPTIGGSNFRDLEILAAGTTLVTLQTMDLWLMGIEDKINCHIYETPEDAVEILNSEWNKDIAYKGWETIFFGRKWWQQQNQKNIPYFRYNGVKEFDDLNKDYLSFYIDSSFDPKQSLIALKNNDVVKKYKREKDELKVYLTNMSFKETALLGLGFVEWSVDGHTIFHRMNEVSVFMNKTAGVKIPPNIKEIINTIQSLKK